MKILYFSRSYTPHDFRFLSAITGSRHQAFFLPLEKGIATEKRPVPSGVRCIPEVIRENKNLRPETAIRYISNFEDILHDIDPGLVHAGPVPSCGFLTALADFHPFLCMSWGSDILLESQKSPYLKWISRYTLSRSDWFFCDCDAVRNKVQEMIDFSDERILQFPWGVEFRSFSSPASGMAIRQELGWDDCFVVLSTRMWETISGISTVLRAFRDAYRKNPSMRLILLGTGSYAAGLHRFIARNHLNEVIHAPGIIPQDRISPYFRASDLYLSCSISDGSSISLLEAMGHGLPVLVSDIPGNREWVTTERNGWLAETGKAHLFTGYLLAASKLPSADRKRISDLNIKVIRNRADWERNILKLISLYDKIEENDGKSR